MARSGRWTASSNASRTGLTIEPPRSSNCSSRSWRGRTAELEAKHRRIADKEERLEILANLIPQFDQEDSALRADVATWKARPDVPPTDIVRDIWARNRGLNIAKRVLFSVTGDMRFAKDWDALDDLRFFWHQQEQQRARIFTAHAGTHFSS